MSTTILDHFDDIDEFESALEQAEVNASKEREMEFVDSIRNKYDEYGELVLDELSRVMSWERAIEMYADIRTALLKEQSR